MKIKVNRNFKKPKWLPGESLYRYEKRIETKEMIIPGKIGYSGTKIHKFHIGYIDTEDGIGIVSITTLCGSRKLNSGTMPIFDSSLEITCKKCKP